MPKLENIDAPSVLGITEQQLNLLKIVYKLTSKNKIATPHEITLTYTKDHSDTIHTSNLFRQLKILQDKQFLTREGEANYRLNFDGIKNTLDTRKQEYHQTLEHYTQLTDQLEEYFKKATATPDKTVVEYLDYNELFAKVTESIKKSDKYYITSKFPGIVYTYSTYSNIGRGEYMQTLSKKCFETRDLEVFYMTPLDLDYPFTHSMKLFQDKDKALKECDLIITQLESMVDVYNNLHIMHLANPYGLDVVIPEGKMLDESYIFVRDERMNVTSGIYIKSHETAKRSKETFLGLCSNAHEFRGEYAKKVGKTLRRQLKEMSNGRTE